LIGLRDVWARATTDAFVRQTRFDPLHLGESDQELHDRLPLWLELLTEQTGATVSLPWQGKERSAEISRAEILSAAEPAYGHLTEVLRPLLVGEGPATVVLSARAARLPGLAGRLAGHVDGRVHLLETGAAALGAWSRRKEIESPCDAVTLVTRLAISDEPRSVEGPPAKAPPRPKTTLPSSAPTHLLHGSRGHEIREEPLVLGLAEADETRALVLQGPTGGVSRRHCSVFREGELVVVSDHSTWGTFVNGKRVDGRAPLAVGDRLRVGSPGIELELISVEGFDGEA
jgi:hypothetical protein